VQLAVVARFYERIGDHAVNIGEKVPTSSTGWLPEHAGRRPATPDRTSPPGADRRGLTWSSVSLVIAGRLIVFAAG
jgi:phosphate uptake regulator